MDRENPKILDSMPFFSDGSEGSGWQSLRVSGLVTQELSIVASDLAALPRREQTQDFRCEEGWVVPDQKWEGVPVSVILDRAGVLPVNPIAQPPLDVSPNQTTDTWGVAPKAGMILLSIARRSVGLASQHPAAEREDHQWQLGSLRRR